MYISCHHDLESDGIFLCWVGGLDWIIGGSEHVEAALALEASVPERVIVLPICEASVDCRILLVNQCLSWCNYCIGRWAIEGGNRNPLAGVVDDRAMEHAFVSIIAEHLL